MKNASWLYPAAHPDDVADDLGFIGWGEAVDLEWFIGWVLAGDVNQPSAG
jgi:hypothetical protein